MAAERVPEDVRLSKRLSFVLRHRPDSAGLELDAGGWVDLAELCRALGVSPGEVEAVVAASSKQRYALLDGRIRAQQGHSVAVDLGYGASEPPSALWHGTATRNVDSILREGLHRRARHAVHLSVDRATAEAVGRRRGPAVVLQVASGRMSADGHVFTVSGNGVWLVHHVPAGYLTTASE